MILALRIVLVVPILPSLRHTASTIASIHRFLFVAVAAVAAFLYVAAMVGQELFSGGYGQITAASARRLDVMAVTAASAPTPEWCAGWAAAASAASAAATASADAPSTFPSLPAACVAEMPAPRHLQQAAPSFLDSRATFDVRVPATSATCFEFVFPLHKFDWSPHA